MGTALERLPVLVVDCQTTGARATTDHLLEVGWCAIRACEVGDAPAPEVRGGLVRLPEGARIPRRVSALTGIADADLLAAPSPGTLWRRLREAAARVARLQGTQRAVAVAHFARLEEGFLRVLHEAEEAGGAGAFPLDFVCTHEIARRLLPDLPRRGLRALAGYLGHVTDGRKRASAHVRATAVVWAEVVSRLREEHDATTLADLRRWLRRTAPARGGGRGFALDREERLRLPERPGLYRLRARGGEVLYVGKATSLRRRVNGYFQKRRHGRRHMPEVLVQTRRVDVEETATALEAALREADEIKQARPLYNVALGGGDGCVWFASPDLDEVRPAADRTHPVGPWPRADLPVALGALARLHGGRDGDRATWARALGIADAESPAASVLGAGLDAFRRSAGLGGSERTSLPALYRAGGRLFRAWREARDLARQEKAAEAEGDEERDEDGEEDRDRPSARRLERPQEVASRLTSVLRQSSHLLRRARWLCRLAESSVAFRPPERGGEGAHRLLVLRGGRVVRAADVAPETPVPVPPGHARSMAARRARFDVATYDRLRVLGTELKRLTAAGARVDLRLGPHLGLSGSALARRLRWV